MTLSELKVDLAALSDAITSISSSAATIDSLTSQINQTMQSSVDPNWVTPAGTTFVVVQQACTAQMTQLTDLLAEIISRMKSAYQNYLQTEVTNVNNVTARNGAS